MSSPIAIPRTPSASTSRSASGSPTGVYVPIHKRKAVDSDAQMASCAGSVAAEVMNGRPIHKRPSFIYQSGELRALAASPLVGVAPARLARLEEIRTFIVGSARPAPSSNGSVRRRRAGRRVSNAKKLQAEVHVDVESRRRRHGAWGWSAHEADGAAESWRHPGASVGVAA